MWPKQKTCFLPKNSQVISSVTKKSPKNKKIQSNWLVNFENYASTKILGFDDDELVAWLGRASGTTWFYFWKRSSLRSPKTMYGVFTNIYPPNYPNV